MIGRLFGALVVGLICGVAVFAVIVIVAVTLAEDGINGLGVALLGWMIGVGGGIVTGLIMAFVTYRTLSQDERADAAAAAPTHPLNPPVK